MRNYFAFAFIILFASCNSGASTAPVDNPTTKTDSNSAEVSYPYAINYSTKFEFIDPQKGKMILDVWKDFDNNTLDNSKDKFADTVDMKTPGHIQRASRDSIISSTKSYRDRFTAVTSKVDVVLSVRSTDQSADWVLVWGKEIHTDKKNKTDSVEIHELWGLNKEGKIETMEQYVR